MNNISRSLTLAVLSALLLSSCAKETSTAPNFAAKLYFDSWIQVWQNEHGNTAREAGNGIWILEEEVGTGDTYADSCMFANLDYTITDLQGNVSGTTYESVAKRVGTYNKSYYYGPKISIIQEGGCYAGLQDALSGMKIGGRRKVAIPSWLMTTARYDSPDGYLAVSTNVNPAIYDITLREQIYNIYDWETDSLDVYAKKFMNGADSTFFAGDSTATRYGFYFEPLNTGYAEEKLPSDTTFKINYVARLLNGQVFDTTIADTAKVWNLYDPTKTYKSVEVTLSENVNEITMNESSNLILGFQAGCAMLHKGMKGRVAFYSSYGYTYSGTGSAVPPFSPLVFDLFYTEE